MSNIAHIARRDPHSALVVLSKSLQNEWSFNQQVVNANKNAYIPLKEAICINILPQISGFDISDFDAEF